MAACSPVALSAESLTQTRTRAVALKTAVEDAGTGSSAHAPRDFMPRNLPDALASCVAMVIGNGDLGKRSN
jgi:hypothetical protein